MSKLETQYQGENVIIVGADSDCLSVLQSFVLGEDMGKHSKYVVDRFRSGSLFPE